MIEIAHRGYSDMYKDNSKMAFLSAVDHQFDMIEFDIQLSKDEQIFVYHDTFIGNQLLKNLTFCEIKQLDSDILLLSDFFEIVNVERMKIYLDIKGNDTLICPFLFEYLKDKPLHNIFIASFNTMILDELYRLEPKYQIGVIMENIYPKELMQILIEKYNVKFFSFHWTMLEKSCIDYLHEKNVKIYSYTCKNNDILSFMKEFPIDGIVSNYKLNLFNKYKNHDINNDCI